MSRELLVWAWLLLQRANVASADIRGVVVATLFFTQDTAKERTVREVLLDFTHCTPALECFANGAKGGMHG